MKVIVVKECEPCRGEGKIEWESRKACAVCGGTGELQVKMELGDLVPHILRALESFVEGERAAIQSPIQSHYRQ